MTRLETMAISHPFFTGFAAEELVPLLECAREEIFPTATFVLRERQRAENFYLILSGKLCLEIEPPHRAPIRLQTLGKGDVLGWSWLFPPYRWHFDALTLEPTHVVAFDAACLRRHLEHDPRLGYQVMQRVSLLLVQRLQATRLQLLDLYGSPAGGGG